MNIYGGLQAQILVGHLIGEKISVTFADKIPGNKNDMSH
jgi:hypothetical protein